MLDALTPDVPIRVRSPTAYHRFVSHKSPLDSNGFLGSANLDNDSLGLIPNVLEGQGQIRRVKGLQASPRILQVEQRRPINSHPIAFLEA